MARAIDKDYLLKHKRKVRFFGIGPDDESWGYAVPVEVIENAPTLTPPNEWVRVEERLPEESDGMVLFTNGRAVTSGYRNHMFRMSGEEGVYAPEIRKGGGYMRVTHWMHLPAPPGKQE